MLTFPNIDPIALSLGPVKIYWYAIAYIIGFLFAVYYGKHLLKKYPNGVEPKFLENTILGPGIIGVIIGGRLGHVIFYDFAHYMQHPLEILMTWKGGMSFHGGLLGAIAAVFITAKRHTINPWRILDILAVVTPVGLGLGRLTNFINGELFGLPTTMRWGIIFPGGGNIARHPTQIYEAALEGVILFEILRICFMSEKMHAQPGKISGLFLFLYGLFRFGIEYFKDPAAQGGMGFGPLTQGHILCIPMILLGIILYIYAKNQGNNADTLPKNSQNTD